MPKEKMSVRLERAEERGNAMHQALLQLANGGIRWTPEVLWEYSFGGFQRRVQVKYGVIGDGRFVLRADREAHLPQSRSCDIHLIDGEVELGQEPALLLTAAGLYEHYSRLADAAGVKAS